MRQIALAALLLTFGCGQPDSHHEDTSHTPIFDSANDDLTDGPFDAKDGATSVMAGEITAITKSSILFGNGLSLQTGPSVSAHVTAPRNAAHDTFDAAAPGNDDRIVGVRQVSGQAFLGQDSGPNLCGAHAPTYVALVHDEPMTAVSIIAFSGKDAPGPRAKDSTICAVLNYALNPLIPPPKPAAEGEKPAGGGGH